MIKENYVSPDMDSMQVYPCCILNDSATNPGVDPEGLASDFEWGN